LKLIPYTDVNDFENFLDAEQVVCTMTERMHQHPNDPPLKHEWTSKVMFKSGGYILTFESVNDLNKRILAAIG
tara:strand:- start:14662 stop:14880 length:219 start_codon:yes stop_codon:yes gene_type:complete